MEHEPNNPATDEAGHNTEVERSPEEQRISEGIAEALRDGTTIDHETAWLIAKHISPGSGPLHELARTGAISPDVGSDLETAYEVLPDVADTWVAALDGYCWRRRDKGPVAAWPEEALVIEPDAGLEAPSGADDE
jgi:hypothetical protein